MTGARDGVIGATDASAATGLAGSAGSTGARTTWLDVGRVVAILAVIAIHAATPLVLGTRSSITWWSGNVVAATTDWAIPVLVMLAGARYLTVASTADAADFYRRRLTRLGPPFVVWTVAYLVFGSVVAGSPRDVDEAIRGLLAGRPYDHLDFLFIVAGLVIVAPGLRMVVSALDRRALTIVTAAALALAMGDSVVSSFIGIGGPDAATRFVPYVGYFVAGAVLGEMPRTARAVRVALAVASIGIVATASGTWLLLVRIGLGPERGLYLLDRLSVTTVPVSLAVFGLLVWFGPSLAERLPVAAGRVVPVLAASSLGIYLVHPMVLVALDALGISASRTIAPVALLVTVALAFVLSVAVVLVARVIPYVRALV